MERVLSEGIIYKISKYADNSAIASAYTYGYGRIKLFMPKAYSSKGGVQTFIPGEIDFLKKDTSELNKLSSLLVILNWFSRDNHEIITTILIS